MADGRQGFGWASARFLGPDSKTAPDWFIVKLTTGEWGMRKALIAATLLLSGTAANAQQNSTTNCYTIGGSLHCNTQTQPDVAAQSQQVWQQFNQNLQQQQQQQQQNMQNLGAAIAVAAERRRERQAAEQAAAQQAAVIAAANAAVAADTATAEPTPLDEKPVMLVCTISGQMALSLALYEKHNRVDVTSNTGMTKTRAAVFTPAAVTWAGPIWNAALNRFDGSIVGTPNIGGVQTVNGTCSVAAERKF